jgi:APA family basic amino acid/polyamine antiporter
MTSVLAWVSARYTLVLFDADADITSGLCIALGAFYLVLTYVINVLSPKIAGKFQVSATIIKLIPLAIMMIVGTIAGLVNGNTVEAFTQHTGVSGDFGSVFAGVAAAASRLKIMGKTPSLFNSLQYYNIIWLNCKRKLDATG